MDDDFDEDFDDDSAHSSSSPNDNSPNDGAAGDNANNMAKRKEQLGFAPQKEVTYNKLLPYAGAEGQGLDEESSRWFCRIKANLARSVAVGDIRPGFVTWVSRLTKYLRFYGFKFPKEDHISLVRLLFSFCTQPDLEPWLVHKSASAVISLMKKKELLLRTDLTLPWRPIYETYERLLYSPYEPFGMLQFPPALENTLRQLARCCRDYFPPEATAEMLDEWRPLLCPFDVTMGKAMGYFEMFLPTLDVADRADSTYRLWFGEFMSFWDACSNAPPWEPHLMCLFSRLADHNIGEIDWEPHMSKIFARIQKNFNLPVMYKNTNVGNKSAMVDVQTSCRWIVATIGGKSSTHRYLDQMVQCMESYYHTANSGRHSQKLSEFLVKLTSTFIKRLNRERFAKERWGFVIPSKHKLTEDEITAFVDTVKPIALQSMYSKTGMIEAGASLQYLATMRPASIIPTLVERMYEALDTLTEPHKLTASMHAVVSVSRSLVYPEGTDPNSGRYPEGPTHVIPLMMATLPGIDPNDTRKAMVTFQFLSTFCTLIPMVDCSSAHEHHPNMSEDERLICGQTSELEDFVVQFLERCFNVIESSVFEQTRQEVSVSDHHASREDSMKDIGMASTFNSILVQSSSAVYDAALRKMQSFVQGRILEARIAGKIAAGLCRCLCKNRPEKGLPAFLPLAIEKATSLLQGEDILKENTIDEELKFNLLLIAECIRIPGFYLIEYIPSLESVLERVLHMTNKDGYTLGCSILRNILRALTLTFPMEYKAIPEGYDRPLSEYLPIKDWGRPGNIHNLKLEWHLPSSEEITVAQKLINRFLGDELEALQKFSEDKLDLSKDQLRTRLLIVNNIMMGSGCVLPFWGEEGCQKHEDFEVVKLAETSVDVVTVEMATHPPDGVQRFLTFEGKNVRQAVVEVLFSVQKRLLKQDGGREDDTKSLHTLVATHQTALLFGGVGREDYDARMKSYQMVRRALENRLVGGRRQIRALLVDRALLQHEQRLLDRCRVPFTKLHAKVADHLLDLSISHYSYVRAKAQDALSRCLGTYSHSYMVVMPRLLRLIEKKDDAVHEEFKGALYVILGNKNRSLLTKHNWQVMEKLWPALTRAQHSEKPSIVKLFEYISDAVFHGVDTFSIRLQLSRDVLVERCRDLWDVESPLKPITADGVDSFPSNADMEKGLQELADRNETNMNSYLGIINSLCDQIESGEMHWRHYNMALGLVSLLTRYDEGMPTRVAVIAARNLVHDDLIVRKMAIHMVGCLCKQQKRKHPKREIRPVEKPGSVPVVPGDREDNLFMVYDESRAPKNAAEWDEPRFVHKTHWGFYAWPKKMLVYAPQSEQPPLDRDPETEMNGVERELVKFFTCQVDVDKLVGYLSLEEQKGRDRFDSRRFTMFKGLFRNFGDVIVEHLRPHMERLVEEGQESGHRCVAEILAALIRGSKHWPYDKTERMWSWVVPLIRKALDKISIETLGDWGTCFATASESRDPNRLHWMMEVLMEEPLQSRGAFLDSSRLYVLQGAIAQQEWRAGKMLHRLMDFLRPYCSHQFQNVRERMGSVLTNVFLNDLHFSDKPEAANKRSPKVSDFIAEVVPQLEILTQEPDPELMLRRPGLPPQLNHATAVGQMMAGQPKMAVNPGIMAQASVRMSTPNAVPPGVVPAGIPLGAIPPGMVPMGAIPPGAVIPPEMLARFPGPQPPGMPVLHPAPLPPEALADLASGTPPQEVLSKLGLPAELVATITKDKSPEELAKALTALGNGGIPGMPPPGAMMMPRMPPPPEVEKPKGSAEYEKRQEAVRLGQTVCKFLSGALMRAFNGVKPECFKLLPILCMNESNEIEPHLAKDCIYALACLSQAILPMDVVEDCLNAVEQVAGNGTSWKAKCSVLDFLSTSVFTNMPTILSRPEWADRVTATVTKALTNERVEVREKAAVVLGGLVHCRFINEESQAKMLATFTKNARSKLNKKKRAAEGGAASSSTDDEARMARAVLKRHSGVLGLCAFVSAYPYDVPEFVPGILMDLSQHLQDPQPINTSVKKTLQEFKRTHQDNWQDHKLKFSEDELAVLTDLLVSPSYYA